MNCDIADIADFIEDNDGFAVYFHKNPDGDAVGSAYALVLALKAMKKEAYAVCADEVPEGYRFMTDKVGSVPFRARHGIAVDTSAPYRLGEYENVKMAVVIDHHENNQFEAKYKYVLPESSSCAEIVYSLIREMGVPISSLMADLLYTGIITDTARFCSRSVNRDTFRTAYELSALGADTVSLGRRFTYEKDSKRLAVEKRLLEHMSITHGGLVAVTYLSHGDFEKLSVTPDDTEGINEVIDRIKGVGIGVLVRERIEGKCRISVRTSAKYNADRFCALFGGGGHRYSGGCQTDGSAKEIAEKLSEAAGEFIDKQGSL